MNNFYFQTGKPQVVTANMADTLRKSRYASHFDVTSSCCAAKEPVLDAYGIADPFKGLGIETTVTMTSKSCCGSKPCC